MQIEGNYPTLSGIVGTELPVAGVQPAEAQPVPPSVQPPPADHFYLEWLILAAAVDRLALVVYCLIFTVFLISYV